jgi:hypothetical protein
LPRHVEGPGIGVEEVGMRNVPYAAIAVAVALSGCCALGPDDSRAGNAKPGLADYHAAAGRVLDGICGLGADHPYLRGIEKPKNSREDGLYFSIHHTHGVTGRKPNVNWAPGRKVEETVPVFSRDGLLLSVYVFLGTWDGQALVLPSRIGDLNVVVLARGPRAKDARNAIDAVVAAERKRFAERIGE